VAVNVVVVVVMVVVVADAALVLLTEGKTAAVKNSTGLMTAGLGGRPLFFLGGERSSSSPAVLAAVVSASEPYFIVSLRIRFALPLPFVVVGARVVSLLPFIIIMIT